MNQVNIPKQIKTVINKNLECRQNKLMICILFPVIGTHFFSNICLSPGKTITKTQALVFEIPLYIP